MEETAERSAMDEEMLTFLLLPLEALKVKSSTSVNKYACCVIDRMGSIFRNVLCWGTVHTSF